MAPTGGDAATRRRAAAVAGHTGDHDTARRLVGDPDARVRATALGALDRLGRLTADDLRMAAEDSEPTVRRRGAELAASHPEPGAEPVLLTLLDDVEPVVVEMAAWATGERDDPSAALVERVEAVALGHDDALCREAAVAALGSIGDPARLPTVLAAVEDKATVRRRAIIALAPFEGPEVEAALRRHLEDRDRQVRQAAEDLLGRAP